MTKSNVLVYWRRTGKPYAFPAETIKGVDVLTPAEYATEYGNSPKVGKHDGDWHAISGDADDIDEELGLCGDMREISLLCDAMYISSAIHQYLGLSLTGWDENCMFKQGQLNAHVEEDANCYFHTIGKVYGADAEAAARRQYAKV